MFRVPPHRPTHHNRQPLTSPPQHLPTAAFPNFSYFFPGAGPGPGRASGSLPAANLTLSGTFCGPRGRNPHVLSCGLKPRAAASCPGVGQNRLFCGAGGSRQGLVQCEEAVLQQKLENARKQLCFLHCPAHCSALPALVSGIPLARLTKITKDRVMFSFFFLTAFCLK